MTFLHPEFLYFMLPPVFILFYFLLTQSEATATFFSQEVFNKLRVNTKMMTLKARNTLFLLMFIFFVIALAQPVIEEGKVKVQAKSADIMIALDISDSMRAEDLYPSRLERGKQKILDLLELSPQERLGVTAFAKASYLVAPLSFDHRAVHFLVKQLQPSYITEKGTDFMQLLQSTAQMMQENEQKYLLILTDGGDQDAFDDEIAYAKEQGIKVFVLGIGTEKGAPIKEKEGGFVKSGGSIVLTTLNRSVSQLATQTGGTYIESVVSKEDITTMFSEITSKTKKRSLKEEEIT
ncbi:MAG: VWA domain-containing protein, partial [Sulfurimonadaceae bacterium]|nr:VWA domain-containing protein [Sulfurimonadaceae bacterium]